MPNIKQLLIPHRHNRYKPRLISHAGLAVMITLMVSLQAFYNLSHGQEFRVLGYATNVSISELLTLSNNNRASSGLASFTLNTQLNQAAQSKANHMIANDYWSHVAPDGTSPWFFFAQAGYNYARAGENLAYGFSTSSGTVTGWMNSPSHAANILDASFTEVGFGIANGANYQGGENTVVVALYGQPQAQPAPAVQAATPEPIVEPAYVEPASIAQAEPQPEPEPVKTQAPPKAEEPKPETVAIEADQRYLAQLSADGTIIVTGSPTPAEPHVTSNYEALLQGEAHWSLYGIMGILTALGVIYFVRHLQMMYQLAIKGEHYVEGHPMLEASIVYLVIWLFLAASYGVVV